MCFLASVRSDGPDALATTSFNFQWRGRCAQLKQKRYFVNDANDHNSASGIVNRARGHADGAMHV